MSAVLTPPAVEPQPRLWTDADLARMRHLGVVRSRTVAVRNGVLIDAGRPHRFTRDDLLALTDGQFFLGQRAMLIHGTVLVMSKMNQPHATGILLLSDALRTPFGPGCYVRTQMPLDLGLWTDPEPDVAVIAGNLRTQVTTPTTAELVAEVADTTLAYDLTDKAELYATAGVPEYWVLDLNGRLLHVLRNPGPLAPGGTAYRSQQTLGPADCVSPLAAPAAAVAVAALLP